MNISLYKVSSPESVIIIYYAIRTEVVYLSFVESKQASFFNQNGHFHKLRTMYTV